MSDVSASLPGEDIERARAVLLARANADVKPAISWLAIYAIERVDDALVAHFLYSYDVWVLESPPACGEQHVVAGTAKLRGDEILAYTSREEGCTYFTEYERDLGQYRPSDLPERVRRQLEAAR